MNPMKFFPIEQFRLRNLSENFSVRCFQKFYENNFRSFYINLKNESLKFCKYIAAGKVLQNETILR